jgi:hypothetical protein
MAFGSPSVVALTGGAPNGLVSIVVTPANLSLAAGYRQQFTATGHFANGSTQNLTTSVTWSSSAPGVATINEAGLARSVSPGSTTITATFAWVEPAAQGVATGVVKGPSLASAGSISGSTKLKADAAVLVSIAVAPANPSLTLGSTQQFTASGTYSNGSTQNVTSSVTWSSSATAVATISTTGLASAIGPGQTTIEATLGTVNGSTTLSVAGFVLTGSLNTARDNHTATLLENGLVLMAGGYNAGSLASAELYNPATGTFSTTGSVTWARDSHTATLLNNGLVLIAGGYGCSGSGCTAGYLGTAELYNPATGTFSTTGNLNTARDRHTATLLPSGVALMAGGDNSSGAIASAELY